MKRNEGFFLIETAILLLCMFGILSATIQSYNLCLNSILREKELSQALNCCEAALLGKIISEPGLQVHSINRDGNGCTITEIQVVKDEKVIFNVFQIK